MSGRLNNKVAIVTGSGQGIGLALALALAKEGARIVTNNRHPGTEGGDAETAAAKIREVGTHSVPCFCDVSSFKDAALLIKTAIDSFGRLDILINNAGTANNLPRIWNMTEEDWDVCLDSYLKGAFNCIRHAAPYMKEQKWGRVINITSISWLGVPPDCNYSAAKAGEVGLTWAVAAELGGFGVTSNALSPAAATRMTVNDTIRSHLKNLYETGILTEEQYKEMINPPDPATLGPLVVYLCTDEASKINGHVFDVEGNYISIFSKPVKRNTIFKKDSLWTVEEIARLASRTLLKTE